MEIDIEKEAVTAKRNWWAVAAEAGPVNSADKNLILNTWKDDCSVCEEVNSLSLGIAPESVRIDAHRRAGMGAFAVPYYLGSKIVAHELHAHKDGYQGEYILPGSF